MEGSPPLELPPGLLAGRLEGVGLAELFWTLFNRRSTGVLRVAGEQLDKTVFFEDGNVVFARSADPDDRLGVLYLQDEVVTLDQLEAASKRIGDGKRLGTVLIEAGVLTPDQVARSVVEQVERIVVDLFAAQEGEFRFHEGQLPGEELITLDLPTSELLLRGIRSIQSFTRIRANVGGPTTRYGLTDHWHQALDELNLGEGDRLLIERLENGSATVETLCREVFLSNFEIYQALWGFRVLDAVRRVDSVEVATGEKASAAPPAREGFIDVVLRHARALETGVLHAVHGAVERTFHLSEGRCVFATSSDPDDGLVAHLLRGGVISLADREETAKRLLSNKRVGTILLEIGVIDHDDLQRMVRQQVTEVIYDTFRWESAELAFVVGPLPSVEEITVDLSFEALIREGLRRVDSWSRIRKGCGGLGSILALTPDYLQVLDSMQAGEDEWQIVTALRTPRTPLEICRQSDLGDFRVCRILWALHVLDAVEVLQAEAERFAPAAEQPGPTPVDVEYAPEDPSEEIPVLGTDIQESGSVAYTRPDMADAAEGRLPVWSAPPVFDDTGTDDNVGQRPQPQEGAPRSVRVEAKSETIDRLEVAIDVGDTDKGAPGKVEDQTSGDDAWDLDEAAQTVKLTPEDIQAALNPAQPDPQAEAEAKAKAEEEARAEAEAKAKAEAEEEAKLEAEAKAKAEAEEEARLEAEAKAEEEARLEAEAKAKAEAEEEARIEAEAKAKAEAEEEARIEAEAKAKAEAEEEARLEAEAKAKAEAEEEARLEAEAKAKAEAEEEARLEAEAKAKAEAEEEARLEAEAKAKAEAEEEARLEAEAKAKAEAEEEARLEAEAKAKAEAEEEARLEAEAKAKAEAEEEARLEAEAKAKAETEEKARLEAEAKAKAEEEARLEAEADPTSESATLDEGLELTDRDVDGPGELPFATDFDPPPGLDAQIARFNVMQRVVYRAVRAEVGAGAANFIRSCCSHGTEGEVDLLVDVELQSDGSWDVDALKQGVMRQRISDPESGYLSVIEREIEELSSLIGDERANELRRRIEHG